MVIGVDIGGTKIAAGRLTPDARIVASVTLETRAAEGYEISMAQVRAAIAALLTPEVAAIGICAPGPLNPKTGVVRNPPNLPGWRDIPLAQIIADEFRLPCRVENDANAAGLAEYRFGAARGCETVVYATISTGIGTGIVLNGRIHHGKNGAAAEGGHVSIDYRGPHVCNCGVPGCIEALASGTALARRGIAPEHLLQNPVALDEVACALSAWLGNLISLLDPDIIVIGGGISRLGEPLFSRLREQAPQRTINPNAFQTSIVPAALAENAGILGAAAVVLA
jgi:glucokinase